MGIVFGFIFKNCLNANFIYFKFETSISQDQTRSYLATLIPSPAK